MSNAIAVCTVSDPTSKNLLEGFIARNWKKAPERPSELKMVSEDGRTFGIVLDRRSFHSYNPGNKHLMLKAEVDGVSHVPIVVDMIDPAAYQISFFWNLTALRRKVVYDDTAA